MYHDPRELAKVLQQILASDSKRIGFLTGAGSSMAATKIVEDKLTPLIPGVNSMTTTILNSIDDPDLNVALSEIKEELKDVEQPFLLENILSFIILKIQVVGNGKLCELDKARWKVLKNIFKEGVKGLIEVHKDPTLDKEALLHTSFAKWVKNVSRKYSIEVFTTNYDYLFEIGFEQVNLPYYDGFVGSFTPFFDPTSVEYDDQMPKWTKLWKLHGSLGWEYDKANKKIIRSRDKEQDGIMVYPTLLKYDDSRKHPYISYMDRLSSFLRKEDGVIFICGY